MKWQDRRLLDLFGIEHPIIQAPMAGPDSPQMAIAVSEAGGARLDRRRDADAGDAARANFRSSSRARGRPINVNFFCHRPPGRMPRARRRGAAARGPITASWASRRTRRRAPAARAVRRSIVRRRAEFRPKVVSFHFGLPDAALLEAGEGDGAKILSFGDHGRGGALAGGARLRRDDRAGLRGGRPSRHVPDRRHRAQVGTMALVPQVVDAVKVPVIAAGGIGDGRGIAAALALGAAGVQIGTAFLLLPEAKTSAAAPRGAESRRSDDSTALTNVFTGRPARGIVNRLIREVGPMCAEAPAFPLAAGASQPLRRAAEAKGSRRLHAAVERPGADLAPRDAGRS